MAIMITNEWFYGAMLLLQEAHSWSKFDFQVNTRPWLQRLSTLLDLYDSDQTFSKEPKKLIYFAKGYINWKVGGDRKHYLEDLSRARSLDLTNLMFFFRDADTYPMKDQPIEVFQLKLDPEDKEMVVALLQHDASLFFKKSRVEESLGVVEGLEPTYFGSFFIQTMDLSESSDQSIFLEALTKVRETYQTDLESDEEIDREWLREVSDYFQRSILDDCVVEEKLKELHQSGTGAKFFTKLQEAITCEMPEWLQRLMGELRDEASAAPGEVVDSQRQQQYRDEAVASKAGLSVSPNTVFREGRKPQAENSVGAAQPESSADESESDAREAKCEAKRA